MNSSNIKEVLTKTIGGKPSDWRRVQKFKFFNDQDFSAKELNNMDITSLEHADYNQGKLPTSGICRVFVACIKENFDGEDSYRDTTAHVITSDDDGTLIYVSACGD